MLHRVFDRLEEVELWPNWPGATELLSESDSDVTEASCCSGDKFCAEPMAARRRLRRTASVSFCVPGSLCTADHIDDSQSLDFFEAVVAGAAVEADDSFASWAAFAGTSFTGFWSNLAKCLQV